MSENIISRVRVHIVFVDSRSSELSKKLQESVQEDFCSTAGSV